MPDHIALRFPCTIVLGSLGLDKITDTYVTCADRFEDTYLNEMGSQGWEMVNISRLEETVPGSQWCQGVTVGYGFEVAWKRVK